MGLRTLSTFVDLGQSSMFLPAPPPPSFQHKRKFSLKFYKGIHPSLSTLDLLVLYIFCIAIQGQILVPVKSMAKLQLCHDLAHPQNGRSSIYVPVERFLHAVLN